MAPVPMTPTHRSFWFISIYIITAFCETGPFHLEKYRHLWGSNSVCVCIVLVRCVLGPQSPNRLMVITKIMKSFGQCLIMPRDFCTLLLNTNRRCCGATSSTQAVTPYNMKPCVSPIWPSPRVHAGEKPPPADQPAPIRPGRNRMSV